jgi:peptidoglycan/LPS O-acetylase OafA/YrhL
MTSRFSDREISVAWGSEKHFSNNVFALIRLALAFAVIFSHSFPLSMTIGDLAVDMFLAISGLLVARSWRSSVTIQDYLTKRILRIYPAFLVLALFQAFLLAPLAAAPPVSSYNLWQLGLIGFEMLDLTGYGFPYGGLHHVFANNPFPNEMNGSLWTVRYEFVCYVLLAVAGPIFWKRPRLFFILFATLLITCFLGFIPPWHRVLTLLLGAAPPWPRLLSFFLSGVLFYRLRKSIPYSKWLALSSILLLGLAVVKHPSALRLLLPCCGTYLLFWLAYHPLLIACKRGDKGDPSYGVYLYGFPIQQSIVLFLAPYGMLTPIRLALLGGSLSFIAGWLSWHGIEKHCLALKRVLCTRARKVLSPIET